MIEIIDFYNDILSKQIRYKILKGGRGAGKSWAVATWLLLEAIKNKKRILCTREIQRTIKDSVHKLLSDLIQSYNLDKLFQIQRDKIIGINGSEFIFTGLWQNTTELKSLEGIDICWVEEAQRVTEQSIDILTPTIRKPKSQIIFTYNPYSENDAIHKKFIKEKRDNAEILHTTIFDLPKKLQSEELIKEAEWDKQTNYALYRHKWLGEFYELNEGQIFAGKFEIIDELPKTYDWLSFGLDFGYAEDPNVLVKVGEKDKCLYVIEEKVGKNIEINEMTKWLGEIKGQIIADSARPELISHLRSKGYNIIASKKGKNSVLEGIEKIKNFKKIYINKDCEYTFYEFQEYSWKVDKLTNKILPVPIDKNNHTIDAIRYALERIVGKIYVSVGVNEQEGNRRLHI